MPSLELKPTHKVVATYYDNLAIENAAATITDFHEKQAFLNTVYERFFRGFCVKVADTHGIVYAPPSISDRQTMSVVNFHRTRDLLLPRLVSGQVKLQEN